MGGRSRPVASAHHLPQRALAVRRGDPQPQPGLRHILLHDRLAAGRLDPNITLGLFTWNDNPASNHREIDVEFARWGNALEPTNAQFVVQPYGTPGNLKRFLQPLATPSVHTFAWAARSVTFASRDATGRAIADWRYGGRDVPRAGPGRVHLNLWLNNGTPPTDGAEQEVVVSNLSFTRRPGRQRTYAAPVTDSRPQAGSTATPPAVDEADRLLALADLNMLDTPAEERFDRVTRLCRRLFGVELAFVNLIDRDRLFMKSAQGLARVDVPRQDSFCAHTILAAGTLVVEDLSLDPRFVDNPFVARDPGLRFYAGVPLEAPGGQRIGSLCIADSAPRLLGEADRALLRDLALWVQKELNVSEELDRAAEVQRALFPLRPLDAPGWEVVGACRPSLEVGGDFYDWHRSRRGPVVALGDVMGKGMPAAIMMAMVRSALRAAARMPDLGDGIEDAAYWLAEDLEATGTFSTAVIARLEDDGALTMADAGHGHAVIVRADGAIEPHSAGGMPLGIDVGERYVATSHRLGGGDLLVLHSDGLLEVDGGPRSTDDVARLVAGSATAGEAVGRMLAPCDGRWLPDDVTVLVVRRLR